MSSVHSREQAQAITLRQPGHSQHRLIHTSRQHDYKTGTSMVILVSVLKCLIEFPSTRLPVPRLASCSHRILYILLPMLPLHITNYCNVSSHIIQNFWYSFIECANLFTILHNAASCLDPNSSLQCSARPRAQVSGNDKHSKHATSFARTQIPTPIKSAAAAPQCTFIK